MLDGGTDFHIYVKDLLLISSSTETTSLNSMSIRGAVKTFVFIHE